MYPSEVERERNLQEFLKRKEHRQRYGTTSYKTFTHESSVKRSPPTCTVQTKVLIKHSRKASTRSLETAVKHEKPRVKTDAKKKEKRGQVKPVEVEAVQRVLEKNTEDRNSSKMQTVLDTPVLSAEPGSREFRAALETIRARLSNKQEVLSPTVLSSEALLTPTEPEKIQQIVEKGDQQAESVPQAEDSQRRWRLSDLKDKGAEYGTTLLTSALIVTGGVTLSFLDWDWLLDAVSKIEDIDIFQ